ncbi:MAG: ABC transporter ATP-binding protein [Candidatus Methylomirabilia bacterium]
MSGGLASPTAALLVERVSVHFGGLVALSDVSLTIREGEVASLIGPNGAGKTTAFNVITGFLRPSTGSVHYRGRLLNSLRPNQIAGLGVVRTFQKTSVFGNISVFENILIGLHRGAQAEPWEILLARSRVREEERKLRELAMEILEFVGLANRRDEVGNALPYGEQRLLEVAIAMAANPSLLLLDEPVSGMNPAETVSFMEMVGKIREGGVTILLVEHDMRMVMGVSDRVVVLNQGRIIAEGAPEEIQRNPEVIHAYLGHGVKRA